MPDMTTKRSSRYRYDVPYDLTRSIEDLAPFEARRDPTS